MDGSQVGVQHSCKNSLSPRRPPALWHKKATERLKEVRAKQEVLVSGESKIKRFYCMISSRTRSFFLPLEIGSIGIMWVLNIKFFLM